MPLEPFDDRAVARGRDNMARQAARRQTTRAIRALVDDIAYFWWAFAGLGAVMWVAAVC